MKYVLKVEESGASRERQGGGVVQRVGMVVEAQEWRLGRKEERESASWREREIIGKGT